MPHQVGKGCWSADRKILAEQTYYAQRPTSGVSSAGPGFEYRYGGVIMGADLVWRDAQWVADPSASRDPDIRKAVRAKMKINETRFPAS